MYTELFTLLYPNKGALEHRDRPRFKRQLRTARVWWQIKQELGVGVIAVIPTSSRAEISLLEGGSVRAVRLWMDMVKKYNPQAVVAGRNMVQNVTCLLAKQQPSRGRLLLEGIDPHNSLHRQEHASQYFQVQGGASPSPQPELERVLLPTSSQENQVFVTILESGMGVPIGGEELQLGSMTQMYGNEEFPQWNIMDGWESFNMGVYNENGNQSWGEGSVD